MNIEKNPPMEVISSPLFGPVHCIIESWVFFFSDYLFLTIRNGNDSLVSAFKSVKMESESFLQQQNNNIIETDCSESFDHNEYQNQYKTLFRTLKLLHSHEHVILQQCQVLQCANASVATEFTSTLWPKEEKEGIHLTHCRVI